MYELVAGVISLLFAGGILMVLLGLAQRRQTMATLEQRMAEFSLQPKRLEELELSRPFFDRVGRPFFEMMVRFMSRYAPKQNMERIRQSLDQAGQPFGWQPLEFMAVRGTSAVVLGGATFGVLLISGQPVTSILLFPMVMIIIGYLLPGIWLGRKIAGRKKSILKALPDAIDLLSITVEAGLGFDQALQRVSVKWDNDLGLEFQRTLSEMRIGKSRREALKELANRTGVDDLNTFVTSVIQADQLGVSMTQVLRIQSAQLRQRRRQRAEEQAHRAPILMLFPMVFLIFPALYVVILGPAIPQVIKSLSGSGL